MSDYILISNQTEAENDKFLIEGFYEGTFVDDLINGNQTVITGRKGAGKTALAMYFLKNCKKYGLENCFRIKVDLSSIEYNLDATNKVASIVLYILAKILYEIKDKNFDDAGRSIISDRLKEIGWIEASSYDKFIQDSKEVIVDGNAKAGINIPQIVGLGVSTQYTNKTEYKAQTMNLSLDVIKQLIYSHLQTNKSVIVFLDDITDHLDDLDIKYGGDELNIIRDLLHHLDGFNAELRNRGIDLRFIGLLRDDIFDNMSGPNVNKLEHSKLSLDRTEDMFYGLIKKRIIFLGSKADEEIRDWFPDEIFEILLSECKTKSYHTKFYQYIAAISFNRPRDFLQFFYSLRNRLSKRHAVESKNLDSAEGEYVEYFYRELKDELGFLNNSLGIDSSNDKPFYHLILDLSKKDGFQYGELKTLFNKFFKDHGISTKASNRILDQYLNSLFKYGVIGYSLKTDSYIKFKYLDKSLKYLPRESKEVTYYLHRGIWRQKRKYSQ